MPVIAIVNRKGGSGKSTLATHLAAYGAYAGHTVMLGDVDHQQSTQTWLRLRTANSSPSRPRILGWAVDPRRGLRAPVGTTHVILDTPGGLTGLDLARVVMFADVIVMPVCNSVFDRESAAQCHAELMKLPRVASGRCMLAAVGMRLDARTRGAQVLREWAAGLKLPFVGVLRDTQAYVRCVENGMTLFDLPPAQVQADLLQWEPILRWLAPVLQPVAGDTVKPVPSRESGSDARVEVAVLHAAPATLPPIPASAWAQEPAAPAGSVPRLTQRPLETIRVEPPVLTMPVAPPVVSLSRPLTSRARRLDEPAVGFASRMLGLIGLRPGQRRTPVQP